VTSQLASLYKGNSVAPVATAPKPQAGKKVWIISVAQSALVSAQAAQGAANAAHSIGWQATIFDGKGNPATMLSGIQQAIAAKADGIITYAVDCSYVKTGLQAAKAAGIPVVAAESQDCTPSLEHVITYAPAVGGYAGVEAGGGVDSAVYLIAKAGPHATLIDLKQTDSQATVLASQAFEAYVKKECSGCTSVVVPFTTADIGPSLQQKVQQALLQHPNVSGIFTPYDTVLTSGTSAAVLASGRAKSIYVIGDGGDPAVYALIREGRGATGEIAFSTVWEGYASVDWMNRLFHGITPDATNAATGIGFQVIDADHGLPATGAPPSPVNFQADYAKAWGVK
jgi:ribose transport system substrate-binding protein